MESLFIYYNPRCNKCRIATDDLREHNIEFEIVEYLKTPLNKATLGSVLNMADDPPEAFVRKDHNFEKLGLNASDYTSAEAVVELLLEHPILMQRPVIVRNGRAVITRSPEKIKHLLEGFPQQTEQR